MVGDGAHGAEVMSLLSKIGNTLRDEGIAALSRVLGRFVNLKYLDLQGLASVEK